MAEESKEEKPEVPKSIHEPVVDTPNGKLLVIGTDHGEDIFTGRSQTEEELVKFKKDYGSLDGLVVDSLGGLSYQEKSLSDLEKDGSLHFLLWAEGWVQANSVTLIVADPVVCGKISEGVNKELAINAVRRKDEDLQAQSTIKSLTSATGVLKELQSLPLVGLEGGLVWGLYKILKTKSSPINRRQFLKFSATTLGAIGTTYFLGWASTLEQILSRNLPQTLAQENKDLGNIRKVFGKTGELNRGETESPEFVRREALNIPPYNLNLTLLFRNALIAEIVSLPSSDTLPWTKRGKANSAVIMGFDHFVLPEKERIGYLVTHPEERKQVITNLLTGLWQSSRDGLYDQKDFSILMNELDNYSASYIVDKNRKVSKKTFKIPLIRELRKNFGL